MPVQTQVNWLYATPMESIESAAAKGAELAAEGKTIGEAVFSDNPDDRHTIVVRTWIDESAAQDWVDYILANFNVASAVIINPE